MLSNLLLGILTYRHRPRQITSNIWSHSVALLHCHTVAHSQFTLCHTVTLTNFHTDYFYRTTKKFTQRSITASYYRDAHAVMVVYDTTRPSTFDHVHKWLIEIDSSCQDNVKVLGGGGAECDWSILFLRRKKRGA